MTTDLDKPARYFAPFGGKTPGTGSICSLGPQLEDGSSVFVAAPCASQTGYIRVFADGHRALVPFPKHSADIAFGETETIAYGGEAGPWLARLEGKQWHDLDTGPMVGTIRVYAREPKAEWALADRLYRKPTDGEWSAVDAPDDIRGMWVVGPDDVWLLRREGRDGVLLRTIAPTKEARFDWQ
jgi:hypothetical protein